MHFFTQSSYSFRSTCPYQHSLFCCTTDQSIISLLTYDKTHMLTLNTELQYKKSQYESLYSMQIKLCHLYLISISGPYLEICFFSLNATHPPDHSHPCSLNATSFSFLTGQVSLPCNMLLRTQLLYNLPLIINDTSLFVSSGTNCLYLFQPIRILASTAASASQSTLSISPR